MIEVEVLRRLYEFGLPLLFTLVVWRSWSTRGGRVTVREAAFGFALSQTVEFVAVALGRYDYPDWLVYFPPRPAWVPIGIGLGWAALVPCVMRISEGILGPGASRRSLAALDGAMAVGLDLVLDPAVSGEPLRMWLWSGANVTPYRYWLLDVPVFNFVGWFLLIGASSLQLRAIEAVTGEAAKWRKLGLWLAGDVAFAAAVMVLPW